MHKIFKLAKAHKSDILTAFAGIGVVVTAVLASRAGRKVQKKLSENEYSSKKEMLKDVVPDYIPTAVSAVTTIGSMVAARKIDARTIAGLTGDLVAIKEQFRDYRAVAQLANGVDEKDDFVKTDAPLAKYDPTDRDNEKVYRFKESITGYIFESTKADVYDVFYSANREFIGIGGVSFYTYAAKLGVPNKRIAKYKNKDFGWFTYSGEAYWGYCWIDFELKEKYDKEGLYYEILYPFCPHYDENPSVS